MFFRIFQALNFGLVEISPTNPNFWQFRQFNAIGPLFCSFVQHHQLELRTFKTYSKLQKLVQNENIDVQNLENIGSPLMFFTRIFFGTMRLFLKFFGFHQRVSPSFFRYFATQWMSKNSPPLLQFSALWFLRKFFKISQGFPLIFFIFCNQLEFHKAQRVPLLQFCALDIAPTLAVDKQLAQW